MPRQAHATVQQDNATFRITEWRFAPGSETGWHRHGTDYAVVPLSTGPLVVQTADGETINELSAGRSYSRPEGSEHNVINRGDTEIVFVEIELK